MRGKFPNHEIQGMKSLEEAMVAVGFRPAQRSAQVDGHDILEYLNLKLAARGRADLMATPNDYPILRLGRSLLEHLHVQSRLVEARYCPADQAIQDFLSRLFARRRPATGCQLAADQHDGPGTSRLGPHLVAATRTGSSSNRRFSSRIAFLQGICHNPSKDRRTTEGVFHVVEGGYAVPADKREVPKRTFALLLRAAARPPARLAATCRSRRHSRNRPSCSFRSCCVRPSARRYRDLRSTSRSKSVSLLPATWWPIWTLSNPSSATPATRISRRTTPASTCSTGPGTRGCVILAPHLTQLTKKELGLPNVDQATPRQIRDGMCWTDEDELYNGGQAFKVTCRDHRGIIVTLIADNYFGYCKKEVKSQLSYASNLMGLCEEEHAGGALAFPSFDLGEDFEQSAFETEYKYRFSDVVKQYGPMMVVQPSGLRHRSQVRGYHLPARGRADRFAPAEDQVAAQSDRRKRLRLQPDRTYVMPSGYRVEMHRPQAGVRWRLVGTNPEGTFCHKPCTVSGGGKSEISKPITDSMISGPIVTYDFKRDFDMVEEIINRDFGDRYKEPREPRRASRPLLSQDRSLGFGRATAESQPRIHERVQRLGGQHSTAHPRPGADAETVPQAPLERLAATF